MKIFCHIQHTTNLHINKILKKNVGKKVDHQQKTTNKSLVPT